MSSSYSSHSYEIVCKRCRNNLTSIIKTNMLKHNFISRIHDKLLCKQTTIQKRLIPSTWSPTDKPMTSSHVKGTKRLQLLLDHTDVQNDSSGCFPLPNKSVQSQESQTHVNGSELKCADDEIRVFIAVYLSMPYMNS